MSKLVRVMVALVLGAGLVLGLTSVSGAVSDGSTRAPAVSANCAQLRERLVGAPATLGRIDAALSELRARLAQVRLPVRRTILEQRIERLGQLRAALQSKITEARAACGTTGDTTT